MKILYFSPVRWKWIKQRPHFIAEGLSEKCGEVCYCSRFPIGKDDVFGLRRKLSPVLEIREYAVLPFSLRFRFIDRLNNLFLKKMIFRERFDAVILSDPRLADILPPGNGGFRAPVIYECMDRHSGFYKGKLRDRILKKEKELCEKADRIIVSSDNLKEFMQECHHVSPEKISTVRNAVSSGFLDGSGSWKPDPSRHSDFLYAGTVDQWFDWNAVLALAERFPEKKIQIVGPVKSAPRKLPRNIVMPGPVPHSEIPGFLRNAKILMIPFLKNELIESVDPVKMYEYLSLGKNVISSYWKELDYFLPNRRLRFYRSAEEFTGIAETLLKSDSPSEPDMDFFHRNTWDVRTRRFSDIILDLTKNSTFPERN